MPYTISGVKDQEGLAEILSTFPEEEMYRQK
jgi:hypothetical protein